MKICNQKVNVPSSCELNNKDYMTRCLSFLKDLEKNYSVALTEASNEVLEKKYLEHFISISKMQRDIYELMFQYGWYELQTANNTDIKGKYNQIKSEFNSL